MIGDLVEVLVVEVVVVVVEVVVVVGGFEVVDVDVVVEGVFIVGMSVEPSLTFFTMSPLQHSKEIFLNVSRNYSSP